MAYNGDQRRHREDNYGNPVRQTDEYGNPIHHTGQTMGEYAAPAGNTTGAYPAAYAGTAATTEGYKSVTTGDYPTDAATGRYGTRTHGGTGTGTTEGYGTHGGTQIGGYGGHESGGYETHVTGGMDRRREEKGVKENIMEKLTGGGHDRQEEEYGQVHSSTTTGSGGHQGGLHHEKRGLMDKIKDCLPGNH